MVEFAVSLPLLIVMVVGIFDFSGAYTLKQKLANAARNGARAAASDPATDLTSAAVPVSVSDAFQVVDNYLLTEKINDCGIAAPTGAALVWTATATTAGPPPCRLTITINRGFVTPVSGTAVKAVGTQVTVQYDYNWHFNSVITVLIPSAGYGSKLTFQTSSVALNEN